MKNLIRRLSKVSDSSNYYLLRSESREPRTATATATATSRSQRRGGAPAKVPEGHLPVYVGEEMERFVVSAKLLNHPIFVELLNRSAQEYGYEQQGVLRIPCHVYLFERILEAVRLGDDLSLDFHFSDLSPAVLSS